MEGRRVGCDGQDRTYHKWGSRLARVTIHHPNHSLSWEIYNSSLVEVSFLLKSWFDLRKARGCVFLMPSSLLKLLLTLLMHGSPWVIRPGWQLDVN